MPLSMHQVQKLSQRLVMTPQMQQSIKLLQMNTMDLEQLTQQEMLENPFLEIDEDVVEASGVDAVEVPEFDTLTLDTPATEAGDGSEAVDDKILSDSVETELPVEKIEVQDAPVAEESAEAPSVEEQPEQFDEVDVDWGDTFDGDSDSDASRTAENEDWAEIFDNAGPRSYSPPPDDSEQRSFEETVAGGTSLYERLMWQLRVSALNGRNAEIAEFLIGCIDERGYLQIKSTLEECAARFRVDIDRVEEILREIEENTSPKAAIDEMIRFAETRFEKKDRDIGLHLCGHLATAHARPGQAIFQRKPTLEACAELYGVDLTQVERVLFVIQEFDPPGVGARDLPECLLLQLVAIDRLTPLAKEILTEYWPQMMRRKFRVIARELKEDEAEIDKVFNLIRRLQPAPGLTFSKEQPVYITPDVYVREIGGQFVTYLNEGEVAHLRLSNTYKNILLREDTPNQDPKEREYAMDKYRAAVMFIKNIEKRRNTVLRVTEAIMEYQKEFLERGVEALRPLALAEIAEQVSMHESTISRVTSSKYVDTPQGLFELKFFFSSAIRSNSGEAASSRAIKSKIEELIETEDPARPLSDDKIAKQLKIQGFSIARRTVAKYREQMRILPTNLRRKTK